MTTIAWDGRYLAADSRGTFQGGRCCRAPSHKLLATASNAFAATGTIGAAHLAALAKWYEAGAAQPFPIGEHVQGTFIAISPDGHTVAFTRDQPYGEDIGTLVGFGSGCNWAEAAMDCGLDAMAAVAVAMARDCNNGPPIQYIDVADLAAGVRTAGATLRPETLPVTPRETLLPRLDPMVETARLAELTRTIEIRKPSKLVGEPANYWQTLECEGRLALGTGCGHCLRCNREWHVLLKKGGTLEGSTLRLPAEGALGDGVALTSVSQPAWEDRPTPRQMLEDMVTMWNAASARHDRTAVQNIDRAFRSLQFPPGVEMVTDQPTTDHNHFRRRLVWADEGDTG